MKQLIVIVISVSCLTIGCRRTEISQDLSVSSNALVVVDALPNPASQQPGPLFRKLASSQTGIDLEHKFPSTASGDMLSDQNSGAGVCIGDIDGDQLPDIYVTNYNQGNRLYRNLGGFRFEDATQAAGVSGEGRWCAGPSFIDIDNDGDLDLHVCVYADNNLLYINDGSGKFTDQASQFGLGINAASVMMSFADYDLDGDLDAYLVTHRLVTDGTKHRLPKNTKDALDRGVVRRSRDRGPEIASEYREYFSMMDKGKPGRVALVIAGQEDILLRNERGSFRPVNRAAGISGYGIGLSAVWWDFNNDRHPDLYVSNDYKGADQLYRNNGDGTFTDVVEEVCPHVPWYSMGADVGDINNDGWIDLFASDMSGTSHYKQKVAMGDMTDDAWFLDLARPPQYMRNAMFLNSGGGRMLEVAKMAGVSSTDWTWSPKFGDLDNDGWQDLFVANGMSRDYMNSDLHRGSTRGGDKWKNQPVLREKNLAFRNAGDMKFEDVSKEWGLDELSASYGASLGDLDRDGDLDLIATNFDGPLLVYENQSVGNRLLVKLIGSKSNSGGIGARVEVDTIRGQQVRVLNTSQGFMSSNEPIAHFGLGDAVPTRVVVTWPNGGTQTLDGVSANQTITVTESSDSVATPVTPVKPMFSQAEAFPSVQHRERAYDDFAVQPLLPSKKSQLGPGIACGNIDGDGRDDFYLGGAAGSAGEFVLSDAAGTKIEFPKADAECEDMGALFFDADSDGDLDLYVVSGGVEAKLGSTNLQDRLYLRTEDGFTKSAENLPEIRESGTCVTAADFDRDGDLDLFIGGYAVPGSYPESSPSHLLRNDDGQFKDVTAELAPELTDSRLVNAAIWSDVNGDNEIDLVVAQEWGTIDVYLNKAGKLAKSTETGIDNRTGWWNGIAGGDIDEDGDIDFVVTNLGLNTKYHADEQHPARLYRGDFDGSGNQRLVEAKYENGILLPERGKSCSTAAIPVLAERFSTYKAFAVAGLEEIYTPQSLRSAQELVANTLESGLLINDGTGQFKFSPLPRLAQIAPSSGALLTHLDADGHLDLVLAQNAFSPQRETGRMDGGVSLILRGNGQGQFTSVWPGKSGIIITGDAQCVLATDLNNDQQPDLVFGVNNDAWQAFHSAPQNGMIAIELLGPAGNTTGIGAKIEVAYTNGTTELHEVYSGVGYLTQASRLHFVAAGESAIKAIRVLWPDGHESKAEGKSGHIKIFHPDLNRRMTVGEQ